MLSRPRLKKDIRPPNPPWIPLPIVDTQKAVLSFYYSDTESELPVRAITRPRDNKSDPNIETKTYGLFSTCQERMRAGVVREGIEYIFFCTNRAGIRVLTGYYRLGWYFPNPALHDFVLAAKECGFVSPGFPLCDLTRLLAGIRIDLPFRTYRYIDGIVPAKLLLLLKLTPDRTQEYLNEIIALERNNLEQFGFTYTNWKMREGFSWEMAGAYVHARTHARKSRHPRGKGNWRCTLCGCRIDSVARLKMCPECHSLGTIVARTSKH